MNIEDIQSICKDLPGVTEDIKWGNDLVFSVGDKDVLCSRIKSISGNRII